MMMLTLTTRYWQDSSRTQQHSQARSNQVNRGLVSPSRCRTDAAAAPTSTLPQLLAVLLSQLLLPVLQLLLLWLLLALRLLALRLLPPPLLVLLLMVKRCWNSRNMM